MLVVDGKQQIAQMHAILFYVAERFGLAGATPAARAEALSIALFSDDVYKAQSLVKGATEDKTNEFYTVVLPNELKRYR